MAKKSDWWPSSRHGQLAMMKEWFTVLSLGGMAEPWGVSRNDSEWLDLRMGEAEAALAEALAEATRSKVTTAKCNLAFKELTDFARDFKRRYFLQPPLSDVDLISLGLRPRDTILTPSQPPSAQVALETFLVGRHELGIKVEYRTGNPKDIENKGYRIFYKVAPEGEGALGPDCLCNSFFTRRSRGMLRFDYADSGKTCWMAVQVENEGKKGPWGPMTSALIP